MCPDESQLLKLTIGQNRFREFTNLEKFELLAVCQMKLNSH